MPSRRRSRSALQSRFSASVESRRKERARIVISRRSAIARAFMATSSVQKSGNVSEEPWCSTTGGRGRPPALISPSRFSHRSRSENRAGQLLSQKRAREATRIGGLPLVLALVFRLRSLAVGVDLLDAGDAALHFVIEEN